MIFQPTPIPGAQVVELEAASDHRGFFGRIWCRDEFGAHGMSVDVAQASLSFTKASGTLRGLHFAWPPSTEAKLVRCIRGKIFDVILDLRPGSPTFLKHHSLVLDDEDRKALFIPVGMAHGFQTLTDDCEILYMMSEAFRPDLADGVRYDDPAFGIEWPLPVSSILDRDGGYPDFNSGQHQERYRGAMMQTKSPGGVRIP